MYTKKLFKLYLLSGLLLMACQVQKSGESPIALTWEMGKNDVEPNYYESTFYLKNIGTKPLNGNWTIYFNQLMPIDPVKAENVPLKIEWINSNYHKMYPAENYQSLAPGETLVFTYRSKGGIIRESDAPEGFYIVMRDEKGNELQPQNIPLEVPSFTNKEQWMRAWKGFPNADGNYVYEQNALFAEPIELDATAVFPCPKSLVKSDGVSSFTKNVCLKFAPEFENEAVLLKEKLISAFGCTVSDNGETVVELKKINTGEKHPDEYYEITIGDNRFNLAGIDAHAVFNACQTLVNLLENTGELPARITNMQIADYPDMGHRGLMLDVARNFTKKENLLKLIDIISLYKINILHLHLSDDEAWRIEMPGLEELTKIGSRRGHTTDESTCLYPMFSWGWNASDTTSLANGYYSCNDFIDILKYAQKRHIKIIPEIDIPGHSRAAIKSMNARYNKYIHTDKAKAEEYLLIDFADTSEYLSAQEFSDNVINVAMPSTYRFIEKVIDEFAKMYASAGVELTLFHIGGDEVPEGSWEGSAVCQDLMKEKGMTKIGELKEYFLEQVLPMLAKRNIQAVGWEEVSLKFERTESGRSETVNKRFAGQILTYCWNTALDERTYRLANAGYPVILGNVTNYYMDMSYCNHPQERGLSWGGYVNEYNSFDMLPYDIYKSVRLNMRGEPIDIVAASKTKLPLTKEARGQIKGVQAQFWAETVRNFGQIEYRLFPKLFGLIERGWNAEPAWASDNQLYEKAKRKYNAQIAKYELPRLAKRGVNFRVALPGIILRNGLLYANSTIPEAVIRYTIDGSEPTENSAVWTKPIPCDAKQVKAKAFYLGKKSLTTIWNNEKD